MIGCVLCTPVCVVHKYSKQEFIFKVYVVLCMFMYGRAIWGDTASLAASKLSIIYIYVVCQRFDIC